MDVNTVIMKLTHQQNLTNAEMQAAMQAIMQGEVSDEKIKAFLLGLHNKGETVDEIFAAVKVLRQLAIPLVINREHLIDIVGTGGDQTHTFNVSTASSIVAAAAGCHVAKHGNYSVSSKSGSANVLEIAGVSLDLSPEHVADSIQNIGVGFLFAPNYHKAMKHVAPARKELGKRTIFNLLGPLVNPVNPPHMLIGVYDKKWQEPVANVLKQLHCKRALVVHSEDGMDEISISAPTFVCELKENTIKHYSISPKEYGFKTSDVKNIQVENPFQSLNMIESVLENKPGPARDIVALNTGAAIYTAGLAENITKGVKKALAAISSGDAKRKWEDLIEASSKL